MAFNVEGGVKNLVMLIIGIIVIFTLLADFASDLIAAGDNVSNSGLPFAGFFAGSGIILTIFMIGIAVTFIFMGLKGMRGK